MYLQQVGRGLRVSPGKDKSVFIDNVGSYLRFGLPSEHRSWEKYFDRRPTSVRQQIQGSTDTDPQQDGKIEEGNEEIRLVYSTTPEEAVEKTTETPNTPKTVNKKLAPILLLASYL